MAEGGSLYHDKGTTWKQVREVNVGEGKTSIGISTELSAVKLKIRKKKRERAAPEGALKMIIFAKSVPHYTQNCDFVF